MWKAVPKIRIMDTTLRDGMHAMAHQFTPEQMAMVAAALDEAGVDVIEVSHGDGLAGHSFQYGFAAATDEEYLRAVAPVLKKAKLAALVLPGIGTCKDMQMAVKAGVKVFRIATHVTEADISEEHMGLAKEMGAEVVGFLMMSHTVDKEKIAEQARLMESYGADVVYVVDSAGAMTPPEVKEKVGYVRSCLKIPVGFHAHNNLGLAIGNTLAAVEAGATVVDGTLRGLGAGAGNAPTEVLAAALKKVGCEVDVDLYKIMDAATVLEPMMRRPQVIDNASIMLGYAGVYSSFLLHTCRAAEKFGLDPRDILMELGRRKIVGGQEDYIIDVAYEMAQNKQVVAG
jgi:4-hydroxy 2-oxovalerate aldolase